jgi:hypothetical protein
VHLIAELCSYTQTEGAYVELHNYGWVGADCAMLWFYHTGSIVQQVLQEPTLCSCNPILCNCAELVISMA